MAVQIVSGATEFVADTDNETFIMAADVTLFTAAGNDGIAAPTGGGRLFRINGRIDADQVGIFLQNDDGLDPDKIIIGTSATVDGAVDGISLIGGNTVVKNLGRVQSLDFAINISGAVSSKIINSGTIGSTGNTAVVAGADLFTLVNSGNIFSTTDGGVVITLQFDIRNSGAIFGTSAGVEFSTDNATGKLFNEGTIGGGAEAILGSGSGVDGNHYEIVNRGTIIGAIDFGAGASDDLIDNAGGKVSGDIFGGDGNDRFLLHKGSVVSGEVFGQGGNDSYTIDRPNVEILEFAAGGSDTFRSFISIDLGDFANMENVVLLGKKDLDAFGDVGANVLTGNSGDNDFKGAGGADTLRGGRGDDHYNLGGGSDEIIFKPGDGKDVVLDFVTEGVETDTIDLSAFKNVKNFNDLINNHVEEDGNDVIIKLGGGDEITLKLKDPAQLGPVHFEF
jgi:hypothetical protein